MSIPLRLLLLAPTVLHTPALALQTPNPDEPLIEEFSRSLAVQAMDKRALDWAEERECVTCHTNGLALIAQPLVSPASEGTAQNREFAQKYLQSYLKDGEAASGQHGSMTGLVATTAFLALSDARLDQGVHVATRLGLQHAWETLDKSGTWESWLQCNWPPFEVDMEFAPTLMLVALGELREAYGQKQLTADDRAGARKLEKWLRKHPPTGLHGKAMRLWAGRYWKNLAPRSELRSWRKELLEAQAEDGGWSMASLAAPDWQRDGGEAQTSTSEPYPTAFCAYVLLETGASSEDAALVRSAEWLKKHQRKSGIWFNRSPRRDRKHYLSHAATAFSLMLLTRLDEER